MWPPVQPVGLQCARAEQGPLARRRNLAALGAAGLLDVALRFRPGRHHSRRQMANHCSGQADR
jgi:hypothetical protein